MQLSDKFFKRVSVLFKFPFLKALFFFKLFDDCNLYNYINFYVNNGTVAQSVEHCADNAGVTSSILVSPT